MFSPRLKIELKNLYPSTLYHIEIQQRAAEFRKTPHTQILSDFHSLHGNEWNGQWSKGLMLQLSTLPGGKFNAKLKTNYLNNITN